MEEIAFFSSPEKKKLRLIVCIVKYRYLRSKKERNMSDTEYSRYWASRTPEERVAETWRLSVEKYGLPKTSLRDGPARLIRRNEKGEVIEIINVPHSPEGPTSKI
jgi:hypothetical protein